MEVCPRCGSSELAATPTPGGPHHARLDCPGCGRFVKWLPKPASEPGKPSEAVLARIRPRAKAAPLRGTPRQIGQAVQLRHEMLFEARRAGEDRTVDLLKCVTDATWFLANAPWRRKGRARWPSADQLEEPTPTGTCFNCGEDSFDGQPCCSVECSDEYAAFCSGGREIPPPTESEVRRGEINRAFSSAAMGGLVWTPDL